MDLSLDQKWNLVHSDEQLKWREIRQQEEAARKQADSGAPPALIEQSPEWYLRKFMDNTITSKQAGSLMVSLRSKEVGCVQVTISSNAVLMGMFS